MLRRNIARITALSARPRRPHRSTTLRLRLMDPQRETRLLRLASILGSLIFASRWLQVPPYLGPIGGTFPANRPRRPHLSRSLR